VNFRKPRRDRDDRAILRKSEPARLALQLRVSVQPRIQYETSMNWSALFRATSLIAATALSGADASGAQVNVLHAFHGPGPNQPQAPLVLANDGSFYGTAYYGGTANLGAVFKMAPDGTLTFVHQFTGGPADAGAPGALIESTDGNLYGYSGNGIFKITLEGTVTVLHTFVSAEGCNPRGALLQASDGNFYGTTNWCGAHNRGTVFRMTPTGSVTVLHAFTGVYAGAFPNAGLVQATDGNFYGTTTGSHLPPNSDESTIFRLTPTGTFTTLHVMSGNDGTGISASLIQAADGLLYGMAGGGPDASTGTVFSITLDGAFTRLHAFSGVTEGGGPTGPIVELPDGNFYGTLHYGPFGLQQFRGGAVFKMTHAGVVTVLHKFAGVVSSEPAGGLVEAPDGSLYGTTKLGGAFSLGTVFQVTTAGAFTLRHSFSGGDDGSRPLAPLIQAAGGDLYGTTMRGGSSNDGTVFKITPAGAVTLLHSFAVTGDDAANAWPEMGLVQARDGNFYGATHITIFKVTPEGTFTVAHDLDQSAGEGFEPSALIQASDGSLYGTCYGNPPGGLSTAFKLTLDGAFAVLHKFAGYPNDGSGPRALIQASDGNFYGVTSGGGASNYGTLFKMTDDGTVTVLHSFASADAEGSIPETLVEGADGYFYGTTYVGGSNDRGTIFKATVAGGVSAIHSFDAIDGNHHSPLVWAPDGSLYGTTRKDGASGLGTVYNVKPDGFFEVVASFTGANGATPYAGLAVGSGGRIHGTTSAGGASGPLPGSSGTVFYFTIPLPPFTDDPLTTHVTPIKAVHITELRAHIDAARATRGLASYAYTDPTIVVGTTPVKAQHIVELRQALREVYVAAGVTPPSYTDPDLTAGTIAKLDHIAEIRAAVVAIQ
jgi:uncharacterized repeat protein (TIGR03803 family)